MLLLLLLFDVNETDGGRNPMGRDKEEVEVDEEEVEVELVRDMSSGLAHLLPS